MNAPKKLVTELVRAPVIIPVGLTSSTNDAAVDTVVTYFNLIPSCAPNKKWETVLLPRGDEAMATPEIKLSSLEYNFNSFPGTDTRQKALEVYQKAILIIDLPLASTKDQWAFNDPKAVFDPKPTPA